MVVAGQMLVSWRHADCLGDRSGTPCVPCSGHAACPRSFPHKLGRRLGALTICLFLSARGSHSNQHLAIGCCGPQCLLLFVYCRSGSRAPVLCLEACDWPGHVLLFTDEPPTRSSLLAWFETAWAGWVGVRRCLQRQLDSPVTGISRNIAACLILLPECGCTAAM